MTMSVSGNGTTGMSQAVSGASGRMPPSQRLAKLFDQIDSEGSGSINSDQFVKAFSAIKAPPGIKSQGAATVFAQLDPKGTGSVAKQDFIDGMKEIMKQYRAANNGHDGANPGATARAGTASLDKLVSAGIDVIV